MKIVSGNIRSGTSAMMKALIEAGIPGFFDDHKPADSNNPNGYFEHSAVNMLRTRNFELADQVGDAVVKILPCPLILKLKLDRHYKVVFMQRDPSEVADSYWRMLNNRNQPLPQIIQNLTKQEFLDEWIPRFRNNSEQVLRYMEKLPNFTVLKIPQKELDSSIEIAFNFLTA